MAGRPFDSAWLKFGWAVQHGQRLAKSYAGFTSRGPIFQEQVTFDAAASEFVLSVASVEPTPPTVSLALADALGCFRQSLDHVAAVMVKRGSDPKAKSYFAIVEHQKQFADEMSRKMSGVGSDDWKIVEQLHEHIWEASEPTHADLVVMRMLNNRDKHRALQVVSALPHSLELNSSYVDCTAAGPPKEAGSRELVAGRPLARIPVTVTGPNPSMKPEGTVHAKPSIDGFMVEDLINSVAQTILRLVLNEVQPDPPDAIYLLGAGLERPPESAN